MRTRHYHTICSLFLLGGTAPAQSSAMLNINDAHARFYAHGLIGMDLATMTADFVVPASGQASPLFSAGLWMAGIAPGNEAHLAAMEYEPLGNGDFYPGPLSIDGSATTNAAMMSQFDHVWIVSHDQVQQHLAYYECLANPNCDLAAEFPDGYTIPSSFFDWPAINADQAFDTYCAPFIDLNSDGDYVPSDGDAPCIMGDEALFFVFNDKGGLHHLSGGLPLGIEVKAMPFAFHAGETFLDQTVFVRYNIVNRGTLTLTDTRIGLFNDFDLGCGDDDFIGSDPTRDLLYIYNADNSDEVCNGMAGYGAQPPAFGAVMLKGPLLDANSLDDPQANTLPAWNGHGFGDAVVDNERSGMSRAMYINRDGPSCCNDPVIPSHFLNYLGSVWKDGTPLTYGGTGYSQDPNAVPCRFAYPGTSDPQGVGVNGSPQAPWAETTITYPDRRGLLSMGPFTLEPGQHVDIAFAYVYARAANGGALASVEALRQRVDSVRAFAGELGLFDAPEGETFGGCGNYPFTGIPARPATMHLTFAPNPTTGIFLLRADGTMAGRSLVVRDALGREVARQRLVLGQNQMDITALASGTYTCSVTTATGRSIGRVVKE